MHTNATNATNATDATDTDRLDILRRALSAPDPARRLRAALAAGSTPDRRLLGELVHRSAVEEDFFVRDMLTWALSRLPSDEVFEILVRELDRPADPQAPHRQAQTLHTLSKLRHPGTWPVLRRRPGLLHGSEAVTVSTAWRTFVAFTPDLSEATWLLGELLMELGRGSGETRRSLSRAIVALLSAHPELPELPDLQVEQTTDQRAHAHLEATRGLIADPDSDFLADLAHARKVDLGAGGDNRG